MAEQDDGAMKPNRPHKLVSKKPLEEQAKVIDERKKHALMDTHEVIINDGCRARLNCQRILSWRKAVLG